LKDFNGSGFLGSHIKNLNDSCQSDLPPLKLAQMQNHYASEMKESLEGQGEICNILAETKKESSPDVA
jgi:hypothetical protein